MSSIHFHTSGKTASVSGRERGLLGMYCSKALLFSLGDLTHTFDHFPWILQHTPPDCYLRTLETDRLEHAAQTWLSVAESYLVLGGTKVPLFELQLNSAVALGGDPLKLAARLHGQCEVHCYVEGPNRNWLAGMIDEAVRKKIFRLGVGWEGVCELLRQADDSPVVCSYSVCDSFPNRHIAGWDGEDDAWYDISDADRWSQAVEGLRKSDGGLEMTPETWDDFYFGASPISGFDFYQVSLSKA